MWPQNRTECLAQERTWAIRDFPVRGDDLREQGHTLMIVGFPFPTL